MDITSLENISDIFGEYPSLDIKIPEDVAIVDFPKINTYNAEVPQTVKRVKIHKLFDDDHIQITPPIKRINKDITAKSLEKNQTKGIINASSSRTFPCVICKTRQRFILQEMAKCMVCKSCSGTTLFDYICPVCLSD
ncbi:unnamed protein product [Euphydryas editha]|uniref:Uncharacterized protein n=1 Tax=Euphydryas editha TaxID=104508 RepID=A0AAU9TLC2_EUPED|nr:unnamed protein product [Euphydryas editha]